MPEGMNVEVAHQLSEPEHPRTHHGRWHEFVEMGEVIILAVVAVMTAWSGLQAAKWDGRQSLLYGTPDSSARNADRFRMSATCCPWPDSTWLRCRCSLHNPG